MPQPGEPCGGEVTSVTPNCTSCQPGPCQVTGLPEVPRTCQPCGDLLGLLGSLDSTAHLCVGNCAGQLTSTGISGHPDPATQTQPPRGCSTGSTWSSLHRHAEQPPSLSLCAIPQCFTPTQKELPGGSIYHKTRKQLWGNVCSSQNRRRESSH